MVVSACIFKNRSIQNKTSAEGAHYSNKKWLWRKKGRAWTLNPGVYCSYKSSSVLHFWFSFTSLFVSPHTNHPGEPGLASFSHVALWSMIGPYAFCWGKTVLCFSNCFTPALQLHPLVFWWISNLLVDFRRSEINTLILAGSKTPSFSCRNLQSIRYSRPTAMLQSIRE